MRHALLRNNLVNCKSIAEQTSFHQYAFILVIAENVVNLVGRLESDHAAIAVNLSVAILTTNKINVSARLLHPFRKLFGTPAFKRIFAK